MAAAPVLQWQTLAVHTLSREVAKVQNISHMLTSTYRQPNSTEAARESSGLRSAAAAVLLLAQQPLVCSWCYCNLSGIWFAAYKQSATRKWAVLDQVSRRAGTCCLLLVSPHG